MTRTFDDQPAVRSHVPLLVGLMGPSGSGKTFSALRLATGIQNVSGGEIFVVDTESRRALHYADTFKFRHIAFGAPFGSLDYLAAMQHCVNKGAGVIVVDSLSHEHIGIGGYLLTQEAEVERMAGDATSTPGGSLSHSPGVTIVINSGQSDERQPVKTTIDLTANPPDPDDRP